MGDEARQITGTAWYREQAKKNFHDEGTIEIDDDAHVSRAEGDPSQGAYVQAWVWVTAPPGEAQGTSSED